MPTQGNLVPSTPLTPEVAPQPSAIKAEGAGKAYQSVAQSTAIAIQDATDYLRNMNSITATAIGVSLAKFIETGDPQYALAAELAQAINTQAANNFKTIGTNAADVLSGYPSGQ